ncbi:hypothetical protein DPMN_180348 [Dreissena polymorpha]|uniref:Uncharacterized protein n=1 Tax=Dreissena polymorpha TaxID=45954 RepID=A0A9D4EEJ5_DREPO|nr:hypothetical protein DPMN_180348 [Dreissena polymorpha]
MVTRIVFLLLALCCGISESGGGGPYPSMGQGTVGQAPFPKQFGMGQQQFSNQLDIGKTQFQNNIGQAQIFAGKRPLEIPVQFQKQNDIGQVPIFSGKRPLEMSAIFKEEMDIGQMPIFADKRPLEMPVQFQQNMDFGKMPIFAGKRHLEMPAQFQQQMGVGQTSTFVGKRFKDMPAPPTALYNEVNLMPWAQFSGEMQTKFPHYRNFVPRPQVGLHGMGYPFWNGVQGSAQQWNGGQVNGAQWFPGQVNGAQWNGGQVNGARWNGGNVPGADRAGLGAVDNQGRWRQLPADNLLVDVMTPNRVPPVDYNINTNNAVVSPNFRQQMDSKRSGFDDVNGMFVVPLERQRGGFVPEATKPGTVEFVDNTKKDAKKDEKSVPTNVDVVQHAPLVQQGFGGYPSRPLKK